MKIWLLISEEEGDTRVCSAWSSHEKAIVALAADPDYHFDEDAVTDIDSPFDEEMTGAREVWIEEIVVQ